MKPQPQLQWPLTGQASWRAQMLQTYHLHEHIPSCTQDAAGTHFWPVCLGSGWKLHSQEPPEGEQEGYTGRPGLPVTAD